MKKNLLGRFGQGLFLVIIVLFVYCATTATGFMVTVHDEPITYLQGQWQYELSNGETGMTTLPVKLPDKAGAAYRISYELPEKHVSGEHIRIRTSQQSLTVFLDGETVYRFGQERPWLFLDSPGSAYHYINIDEQDGGKTLTLELISTYDHYAGKVNAVAIGSKTALTLDLLQQYGIQLLMSILTGLIGIGLILSYGFFKRKMPINKSTLYLGLVALCMACWTISEVRIIEWLIPIPGLIYLLTFISLLVLPIPMLLFLQITCCAEISAKSYRWAAIVVSGLATLSMVLQLTGIADFMETLWMSHLAVGIVCFLLMIIAWRGLKNNGYLSRWSKALILLIVCAALELGRFYIGHIADDSALFMRIGILLFMAIMALDAWQNLYALLARGLEAKTLEKIAYMDAITKCSNRVAFEQAMEQLMAQGLWHKPHIEMMMFDINRFKEFNDQYGHRMGDRVLEMVGSALSEAFGDVATCYRVGGDEFLLIALEGIDYYEQRLKKMQRLLEMDSRYKICVAYGRSCNDGKKAGVWDMYQEADALMYQCKRQMAQK